MSRITEKSVFLLIIAVITGMILIAATGVRSDVALVPRVIGYPLFVFSLIAAFLEFFPNLGERLKQRLPAQVQRMFQRRVIESPGIPDLQEEVAEADNVRDRYRMVAWIAATILVAYLGGFLWAVAAAIFVWFKFVRRESWRFATIYTLGGAAFVYGVFVLGFEYEFFLRPDFPWWRL